ncbi:MAG: DUF1640 domain-containing protein [Rhodospirillales bacterium]|nr:DUF1640 domain-containing protein [Rhodospirillales bacterium]
MTVIAFDTLKLARKLEAGGFSAQQAESFAEAFADVVQDAPGADQWAELRAEMATKKDLEAFATKKDLEAFATKKDLEAFATKKDLEAFATKKDLQDQVGAIRAEMATKKDLEAFATKKDLEVLRSQSMAEIYAAKHDMLKWAVTALAAQGALIVAILKLLP